MKPLADCRLYAFVDAAYLHGRSPTALAHALCDGGADLIQWRAKEWPKARVRAVAEELAPIAEKAGVWLVINDHADVARDVGAPLCHLGQEDFFDAGHATAADAVGPGRLLGLSTHAPWQAERAMAANPAYVAIGPVWPTGTKPTARPVTLDYVRWAAANLKLPWFAIGGITPGNLDQVLAAGARRVCVVSAILNASDVSAACREFRRRLG